MTPTVSSYSCNLSFLSYSCLTRVSMDPRNKSENDCYKKMSTSMTVVSVCPRMTVIKNEYEYDERMCASEDDCISLI